MPHGQELNPFLCSYPSFWEIVSEMNKIRAVLVLQTEFWGLRTDQSNSTLILIKQTPAYLLKY